MTRLVCSAALVLGVAGFAATASAASFPLTSKASAPTQADAAEPAPVGAFPSPTVAPLTRIAFALGGIGLLGGSLTWWSRRRLAGRPGANHGTDIRVLSRRGIGPKHQLALVDVGDRRLLLGLGSDSIRTLADLSEQSAFETELLRELPETAAAPEAPEVR